MAASADKSKPYIPLNSLVDDRWSNEEEATATCFCGAVQLAVPVQGPGLIDTFVCNCVDCRKVSASAFASNFTIADTHLRHLRGRDNLRTFSQARTIISGEDSTMTNSFCSTCGTLMYRAGSAYPGYTFMRLGVVDDINLHDTKLRPRTEQFVKDRVSWFTGVEGARKADGMAYSPRSARNSKV